MTGDNNSQGQPTRTTQQQQQMIPKHRFDEVLDRLRTLEDQNLQLRSTLDTVYSRQQQTQPQQTEDSPFEPGTLKALQREFGRMLEKEKEAFKHQIGYLHDQNDALAFELKWGQKYGDYSDKIEKLRQMKSSQGQYITREDALKLLVFEKEGKIVKPQTTKQKTQRFDAYTQTVVEDETPDHTEVPTEETVGDVDLNEFQPTKQTQQRTVDAELPPAAITTGAPIQRQPTGAPKLDLNSDEKALAAWEEKFGNVNF